MSVLTTVEKEMNEIFFERTTEIRTMLLCLLAGRHMVMLGEPGVGKSALARELCNRIEGAELFEHLMRRDSTTDELFGPLSLKGLEKDEFRRNGTGRIQKCDIAFVDEVFKANSTVLNGLLNIMNEGIYKDNNKIVKTPMLLLIGASNEYPMTDDLGAVWDRFLMRIEVQDIDESENFERFIISKIRNIKPKRTTFTIKDLEEAKAEMKKIKIDAKIVKQLSFLKGQLKSKGISLASRRFEHFLDILKAEAYLNGADAVAKDDFCALEPAIWITREERPYARECLQECYSGPLKKVIKIFDDATKTFRESTKEENVSKKMELVSKLQNLAPDFEELTEEAETHPSGDKIRRYLEKIDNLKNLIFSETWVAKSSAKSTKPTK